MIKWNIFIQNLLFLYSNKDNITYNLGCAGDVVGRDKNVENQYRYYYNHGWKDKMLAELGLKDATADTAWSLWSERHKGQMCFDCSGLIDWCLTRTGVHKYTSYDFAKMPAQTSLATGVAGSILWKQGHVGVDIGYGWCISIGSYGHTCHLDMVKDTDFTKSILCSDIDYTGSNAR